MADTRAPGWYPAPDGVGDQWWNGIGWSESRRGRVYSASNPAPQFPGAPSGLPSSALAVNARVNPMAMYGLIAGIFSIVFNVLLIPSILAIYFSSRGLAHARKLGAEGVASTLRSPAIIGLVLGIIGGVSGLVQTFVFLGTILAGFSGRL